MWKKQQHSQHQIKSDFYTAVEYKLNACISVTNKAARHHWAPKIVLEFAIKTHFVLDSWKTSGCPWIFTSVLENSWIVFKLSISELLIALNIQESRINIVNE